MLDPLKIGSNIFRAYSTVTDALRSAGNDATGKGRALSSCATGFWINVHEASAATDDESEGSGTYGYPIYFVS